MHCVTLERRDPVFQVNFCQKKFLSQKKSKLGKSSLSRSLRWSRVGRRPDYFFQSPYFVEDGSLCPDLSWAQDGLLGSPVMRKVPELRLRSPNIIRAQIWFSGSGCSSCTTQGLGAQVAHPKVLMEQIRGAKKPHLLWGGSGCKRLCWDLVIPVKERRGP